MFWHCHSDQNMIEARLVPCQGQRVWCLRRSSYRGCTCTVYTVCRASQVVTVTRSAAHTALAHKRSPTQTLKERAASEYPLLLCNPTFAVQYTSTRVIIHNLCSLASQSCPVPSHAQGSTGQDRKGQDRALHVMAVYGRLGQRATSTALVISPSYYLHYPPRPPDCQPSVLSSLRQSVPSVRPFVRQPAKPFRLRRALPSGPSIWQLCVRLRAASSSDQCAAAAAVWVTVRAACAASRDQCATIVTSPDGTPAAAVVAGG